RRGRSPEPRGPRPEVVRGRRGLHGPAGRHPAAMPPPPDRSNPPLPDEVAGEVGKQLQLTLVELIALALAGKQLQWSCYGREFLGVHRCFGELVDEWRELEDVVAG